MTSAVVFAYHDVGVRCLATLLAHDVDVRLVVTHEDNPEENIWFASVAELARSYDIPLTAPGTPNDPALLAQLRAIAPDLIFSFYYRHMLAPELLATARGAAYNMHGSLLPKYRGRVPVNWAILRGETETGASLHYMVAKPDAGELVGQMAVPIHPDDDALAVFRKVTVAAEIVLDRALPQLLTGAVLSEPLDLAAGSYFGGRRAEDGRIDWNQPARQVHNLVRAVAPPYPGAFTTLQGRPLRMLLTRVDADARVTGRPGELKMVGGHAHVCCGSGSLRVLQAQYDGVLLDTAGLAALAANGTPVFA